MSAISRLFYSSLAPSEEDVRSLKEFMFSERVRDELALHKLLEQHPALMGILGFCEFVSEQPLYKGNNGNDPILLDGRSRDRADFLAAKQSPVPSEVIYKSVDIVELKSAATPISLRGHGTRLSNETSRAVGQLRDYKEWLTTVPQNRELLRALGWEVRIPMLHLLMGSYSEFRNNPGHLDELKGRLQEIGVFLHTVDDVLRMAERKVHECCVAGYIVCIPSDQLLTPGSSPLRLILANASRGVLLGEKGDFQKDKTRASVGDMEFVVLNLGGQYKASEARFPHCQVSLLKCGLLKPEHDIIIELAHGYIYSLATGENIKSRGPASSPLKLYPVFEVDDRLYLMLSNHDQ